MALIPIRDRIDKTKQNYINKASINQKLPSLIKQSEIQISLLQFEQTSGAITKLKSRDFEHLVVENTREGFLDITF